MMNNCCQIKEMIKQANDFYLMNVNYEYSLKLAPHQWSKKEILGHLIDSALSNIRRFTECQFSKEVYQIVGYDQNNLVKVNKYQERSFEDLLKLWTALNEHITYIIKDIPEKTLKTKLHLSDFTLADLEFIIEDYIVHLKHHLKQIFEHEFEDRNRETTITSF